MQIYKFRNCFLNTSERRVIKDGKYLELTPRTFDVLQMLVERAGEIVTKDEMLDNVWNGSFVEESNLPVHIAKLRRFLDDTQGKRSIETVHATGYRFIAPVETVNSEVWRKQLSGSGRRHTDKSPTALAFVSIAVLPLRNESANLEVDYLADGLTESFINSLSRIPGLKVLARDTIFRYKNQDTDPKAVGETLAVAAILMGRIRTVGDRLAISIELVKVADGSQVWGNQFDQPFADIIKIRDEITTAVSGQLLSNIRCANGGANTVSSTQSPESYRFFLKGKYFQNKHLILETHKAINCYQKSVSLDPTNLDSYVQIIECYISLYSFDDISYQEFYPKTKPILDIVSGMNQSADSLQAMYGKLKMILHWDFQSPEQHLRLALAINPGSLIAHIRYSEFLIWTGRYAEALSELNKVIQIDPLSLLSYRRIGRLFYGTGRYENALNYLNDALELEPEDHEALVLKGAVLTQTGDYDGALDAFQKSLKYNYGLEALSMIAFVMALRGQESQVKEIICEIESRRIKNNQHNVKLARIYLALGKKEIAYDFLERAYDLHEFDLVGLKFDPRLESIRNEPRFLDLAAQVGIPIVHA